MKAILFKREDRYDLYANTDHKLASTALNPFGKLSKENCDEIFVLFDDFDIALGKAMSYGDEWNKPECLTDAQKGYLHGFLDALELNKDKMFNEDDVNLAFVLGKNNDKSRINKLINSRLQPTEIEVAVEMERIPDGLDENCHIQYAKVPKLDSNGNLILRKL
jgi:hypothetical protein